MSSPSDPSSPLSAKARIKEDVGADNCLDAAEALSKYRLGDVAPALVVKPRDTAALKALLCQANEAGLGVVVWGGGTGISSGQRHRRYDIALDTGALQGVVSHAVENFSVTVQAGLKMSALQEKVSQAGQFLPLDAPAPQRATAGGVTACNASGPLRLRYGSVRDLMLGIKAVLPNGEEVAFGGKSMKHVAGYDVGKLFVGSQGTLGVISEITLRLYSMPESILSLFIAAESREAAFSLARQVLPWQPAAMLLCGGENLKSAAFRESLELPATAWIIAIRLLGDAAAVGRQAQEIEPFAGGRVSRLQGSTEENAWRGLTDGLAPTNQSAVYLKASVPPGETENFCRAIETLEVQITACPGTGRIWASFTAQVDEQASRSIKLARDAAKRYGGWLAVEGCPPSLRNEDILWEEAPAPLKIVQEIKHTFDPNGIMNPGRLVGGI